MFRTLQKKIARDVNRPLETPIAPTPPPDSPVASIGKPDPFAGFTGQTAAQNPALATNPLVEAVKKLELTPGTSDTPLNVPPLEKQIYKR